MEQQAQCTSAASQRSEAAHCADAIHTIASSRGCAKRIQSTSQLTISLSFFIGRARTVLEAGLALKTHGSLVKGFTPLRAGWAGFFLSFRLRAPANLKEPFFLSSPAATSTSPSTTAFTSLALRPVVSATELYAAVAVMVEDFIAFMAFMLFIGAIANNKAAKKKGVEEGFGKESETE